VIPIVVQTKVQANSIRRLGPSIPPVVAKPAIHKARDIVEEIELAVQRKPGNGTRASAVLPAMQALHSALCDRSPPMVFQNTPRPISQSRSPKRAPDLLQSPRRCVDLSAGRKPARKRWRVAKPLSLTFRVAASSRGVRRGGGFDLFSVYPQYN
jgi:hypothetical protein